MCVPGVAWSSLELDGLTQRTICEVPAMLPEVYA